MSHLILHIGTHKTGSTTIQDSFWANSSRLATFGLVYPRLHYRHTGHHGLIAQTVALPAAYHLKSGEDTTLKWINDKYSDSDKTVFLSSEEFSRGDGARSVDFLKLRDKLSGFKRVTVLCFLRPQWRFLQSIYLEISRTRSPPRMPDLVKEAIETGRCQGLYMNYLDLYKRLRAVFSGDEIRLVDFEAARATKGGLLTAALAPFDPTKTYKDLRSYKQGHSNKSPHALSQWAANLLAEPYRASAAVNRASHDVLGKHQTTCILTRSEIADMKKAFSSGNRDLIGLQNAFQPGASISDPALPDECLFREDVSIEHWLKIGQTLARPLVKCG